MANLKFININKIYDNNVQAVFDFNLEVKDKEFVVFVGPSGCGKSTTLRMVAGLEQITAGELYIDDVLINNIEAKDRDIAMVFQNYALYPHMNVYNNLAFGIKIRKFPTLVKDKDGNDVLWIDKKELKRIDSQIKDCDKLISKNAKEIKKFKYPKDDDEALAFEEKRECYNKQIELASTKKESLLKEKEYVSTHKVPKFVNKHLKKEEIDRRVLEAAKILEIENYLNRKPKALSGGQRQRVALGRAIVRKPKVFLMDEPLSNLDAKLRVQMRMEIIKIHEKVGATTIYVTHDQTEAMTMADRIVAMKDGYIQQIGTPKELYSNPANVFVAGFIGSPATNFLNSTFKSNKLYVDGDEEIEVKIPSELKKAIIEEALQEENELPALLEKYQSHLENMKEFLSSKKMSKKKKKKIDIASLEKDVEEIKARLEEVKAFNQKHESLSVLLGIRPEHLIVDEVGKSKGTVLKLIVDASELLGHESIIYSFINNQKIIIKTSSLVDVKNGSQLDVAFDTEQIRLFNPLTGVSIK